jgi:hypothetical protein
MTRHHALAALFFVAVAPFVAAQERVVGANYPLAQKFNKDFVARHVREANVFPQWIGKTDAFWYSARTATGTRYWKVDAAKKLKEPLFDHVALAAALSEASKKPLDADTFQISSVQVAESGKLTFAFAENRYEYDLAGK